MRLLDSGRGIPATAISRLFEPFDRLGIEREGIEGTGIGLALARGLVHEMGGTITVESEAGRGSTFIVERPTAAEPVPPTPDRDERPSRWSAAPPAEGGVPVPVVAVCSADANPAQIDQLGRMGADHYLAKPFDIPALMAIVDEVASRSVSGTMRP